MSGMIETLYIIEQNSKEVIRKRPESRSVVTAPGSVVTVHGRNIGVPGSVVTVHGRNIGAPGSVVTVPGSVLYEPGSVLYELGSVIAAILQGAHEEIR